MQATEYRQQLELLTQQTDAIISGYDAAIAKAKTESVIDGLNNSKRRVAENFRKELEKLDSKIITTDNDNNEAEV